MTKENENITRLELSKRTGQRIKDLRAKIGINQSELARRINKDPQHLEMIENGKMSPNLYTLYIIANGLEVSLSELLAFESKST